jgi:hypothetical protein
MGGDSAAGGVKLSAVTSSLSRGREGKIMFDTARPRRAFSAESVPHWARATAVRVSHEFLITGDEAPLERAFVEAFVEHSALPE